MKPDLVIEFGSLVAVIDVAIVAETQRILGSTATTLSTMWKHKSDKYNTVELKEKVMALLGCEKDFYAGAVIISERGIWYDENDGTLRKLGIPVHKREIAIIRSMEGSVKIYNFLMRATK